MNYQKLLVVYAFLMFSSAIIRCSRATTYTVGDTSGWDISSNLDSWTKDKTFNVGDVLLFQYSSTHSVNEVTKENFESCNTTNVLKAYSAGNTTVTLNKAGDMYFVCGNKLHCLGGMKIQLHVLENNQAYAPTAASPQATPLDPSQLPNPSSKADNNNNIPTSSASTVFSRIGQTHAIMLSFVLLLVSML